MQNKQNKATSDATTQPKRLAYGARRSPGGRRSPTGAGAKPTAAAGSNAASNQSGIARVAYDGP